MTTNMIAIEFGSRRGLLVASACPGFLPRVRPAFSMADGVIAGVADWKKHKSTGVSVPECRGIT